MDWKGKFLGAAIIDIYWFLTAAPSHAFPVLDFSIPPHRLKLSSHGRVSFLEAFSDTAIGSQEPDWTADRTRSQATF